MTKLKELKEWILKYVRIDAGKALINTWEHQKWDEDKLIVDYFNYINSNALEWYKNTPAEYTKDGAFRKLNTAMYKILDDNEQVNNLYGNEECKKLKELLKNTRSKHIKEIEEYKKIKDMNDITNEETVSEEDEETVSELSEFNEEIDWESKYYNLEKIMTKDRETIKYLQNEIEKQDKIMKALCTYVKDTLDPKIWNLIETLL